MTEERDTFEGLGSQNYARAGLLNLFPGFGLGYSVLRRRTAFRTCLSFWLVLSAIGVVAGLVNPGASAFSPRETLSVIMIAALMSWALIAVISADHLLIAAMMRDWRTKGAWSRLAVIMGTSAVLIGSLIYLAGAVAGATALGLWMFDGSLA